MKPDPQYALIPMADLLAKLTVMASEDRPEDLDDAFWMESHELTYCIRDGMEALMRLAREEEIGWTLNAGYRCDIKLEAYRVEAICQRVRFDRTSKEPLHVDIQAVTPQGALAGALLAIFQARLQ